MKILGAAQKLGPGISDSSKFGIPIFTGRDWTPRPEFLADVRSFISAEAWTTEWQAPLRTFFTDGDHIVRWAIRTRRKYTELMPQFVNEYLHVVVVRLRSRRQVEEWVRGSLIPAVTG